MEKVRERLKSNTATSYKILVYFLLFSFSALLVSNHFLQPVAREDDTLINEEVSARPFTFKITDKRLNENADTLYLQFITEMDYQVSDYELSFTPQIKGASSRDIYFNVYQGSNNYYDLVVSNLPEEWEAFRLIVSIPKNNSKKNFTFTRYNPKESFNPLDPKTNFSQELAELRSILYEQEQEYEFAQRDLDEVNAEREKEIINLKEQIEIIQEEMTYHTEEQQKTDQKNIQDIKTKINSLERQINLGEEEKTEHMKRYELLGEKLKTFSEEYETSLDEIRIK